MYATELLEQGEMYLTALLCFPAEEISRHLCGPLPRDCHFWQRAPNQLFQATEERATATERRD